MADTPVKVGGNSRRFTIKLPKGKKKREFKADRKENDTLTVNLESVELQIRVGNKEGVLVTLPLGTEWEVVIEPIKPI